MRGEICHKCGRELRVEEINEYTVQRMDKLVQTRFGPRPASFRPEKYVRLLVEGCCDYAYKVIHRKQD